MRHAVLFGLALLLAFGSLPADKLDQYQILAYRIKPAVIRVVSVVYIEYVYTDTNNVRRNGSVALGGTGSGFIFNSDGYVVTNGHVIDRVNAYEYKPDEFILNTDVLLVDMLMRREGQAPTSDIQRRQWLENRDFKVVNSKTFKKVILSNGDAVDFEIKSFSNTIDEGGKDVGILKIERSNLPVVMLGDSAPVEIQEEIQAFGFPGAADPTGIMNYYINPKSLLQASVTRGRVSSKKQDYKGVPLIQTDAVIAHGSSGGPAVNQKGEVIGVTTYMGGEVGADGQFTQVQGINFLIPINTVKEFIRAEGVEINKGSQFNDIYYKALDYYWNEDWFKAEEQVDAALSLMNDSPDLKTLKEKITIEINNMSAMTKVWKQNKALFLIVLAIALLVVLFVFLLLRSRRKGAELEEEMEAKKKEIMEEKPIPVAETKVAIEGENEKTVLLLGNIDLMVNDRKEGRYPVTEKPLIIGRDPSRANILVQDAIVSKVHCTISIRDNTVVLTDNDSTNGTFIGEQKVTEVVLKHGDVVHLGRKGNIMLIFSM